ncbi:MAG: ribonuclease HI [Firmicutes bacterium]|jgi:ribonuclease HI|nr:ribonuclease HI [Bacillota bacterium]
MKKVSIYTDGACKGNPGPGGWAAVLIYNHYEKEIYGGERHTTNQKMELKAAIEGLKALREPCEVDLFSDSAYLINAFKLGWLEKWQHNGWKTAAREPVDNQDLWRELLKLCSYHRVQWIKVRGHSDNEYNNRCDQLARKAAAEQ